jgi:hypothetical protein
MVRMLRAVVSLAGADLPGERVRTLTTFTDLRVSDGVVPCLTGGIVTPRCGVGRKIVNITRNIGGSLATAYASWFFARSAGDWQGRKS